ncbi:MAG: hypothetical protein V4655_05335, partial [Bdellovibrionota bacterium]
RIYPHKVNLKSQRISGKSLPPVSFERLRTNFEFAAKDLSEPNPSPIYKATITGLTQDLFTASKKPKSTSIY